MQIQLKGMHITAKHLYSKTGDTIRSGNTIKSEGILELEVYSDKDAHKIIGYPVKAKQDFDIYRLPSEVKQKLNDAMKDIEDCLNYREQCDNRYKQMELTLPEAPPSPPPDSGSLTQGRFIRDAVKRLQGDQNFRKITENIINAQGKGR